MDKNLKGLISKAAWSLMQSSRDSVLVNVTQACKSKDLDIKPDQYQKLLLIVNSSFEEGFTKGNRTFDKTIEQALRVTEESAKSKKKSTV